MNLFDRIKDRIQGRAPRGASRSPKWPETRAEHIERHSRCCVCGGRSRLEVHHIIPFHVAPDLELDHGNLMTLCMAGKRGLKCHLLIGHLGNFRRVNPSVRSDAAEWRVKLEGRRSD